MSDRMQATILELAGTCVRCGAVRCAEPTHLRHALEIRDTEPVISAGAAARLITRLTSGPGRIPRDRAERYVRLNYRVVG